MADCLLQLALSHQADSQIVMCIRIIGPDAQRFPKVGDTFGRANFRTRMDEVELLESYSRLLADVYSPAAYFDRSNRSLELRKATGAPFSLPLRYAFRAVFASLWYQGVRGDYKSTYWKFITRVLWKTPRRLAYAFSLAVSGEHMIRYTADDVLPRLRLAIDQVKGERTASRSAA